MNRSITLSLTLAVALCTQVALGGCSKKEDVATPPDASTSASGAMSAGSAPMDSMGSASAVAAPDAASDAASAASR